MDTELYNAFGRKRIDEKNADVLIGLARGIVADGHVNKAELETFQNFLAAVIPVSGDPILVALQRDVDEVLSDGVVDTDEADLMLCRLRALAGSDHELGEEISSSELPLCTPEPNVTHHQMRYCFTGSFGFGSRRDCENKARDLGAEIGTLTRKTNYLVIGKDVTESWKHSTYGNKIIKAVEMREKGVPISIIGEHLWVSSH